MNTLNILKAASIVLAMSIMIGCDDLFEFDLPEANSQPDLELPMAGFSFTQDVFDFRLFQFINTSTESTDFLWQFPDGSTSTLENPTFVFDGEGVFTVSLTSNDANNETSVITREVEVIEPEAPPTPDPVLLNQDFVRLPKSSGSDCACSGWINRDVGEQGESSTGNGSDVIKLDDREPDHAYQEIAVEPNADYQINIAAEHRSLVSETGETPSVLEIRVLAGTGFEDGYQPFFFDNTVDIPQEGFGYTSVPQIEIEENNLLIWTIENPEETGYLPYSRGFNSGANTTVAIYIRGIGNADPPEDPSDFERYGFASGLEEMRVDFINIVAIND